MLIDGHRRMRAAISNGFKEVPVNVFAQKPSEAEILATQLTVNGHRESLSPVEEYEAFSRLQKLRNWTASELAKNLAVSNAEVTRVMAIGKLSVDEKQLIQDGKLGKSSAYAFSRLNDAQKAELAPKVAAGTATRDELNGHARKSASSNGARTRLITCELARGSLTVKAKGGITLKSFIELLEETIRECKKARNDNLDISTLVRVLRDRLKAKPVSQATAS